MKTKAVRLYGKGDLRLEEFELPPLGDDEILAELVSDSICMSSHKAALQGGDHKRVPRDVHRRPTILGHEFCGRILEVGKKWRSRFKVGHKFSIQPALNYRGSLDAPGYSYQYIGGNATHVVIPREVMEMNCLLPYSGAGYFPASLSEPMSCIIGAFKASYHTRPGSYEHHMGIKQGGNLAILAGVGPMGLGMIDYTLHAERRPARLVVTDIDGQRLERAARLYPPAEAKREGVDLSFVNTRGMERVEEHLLSLSHDRGYDDVFVLAPIKPVVEMADRLLTRDGCLNFFAGPTDTRFQAQLNLYNLHYNGTHLVGTSGGNTEDMMDALRMMSTRQINPAAMITHIGGLNAVIDTTLNLPRIPGGKKLIYTQIDLELTAIADFAARGKAGGKDAPLFGRLADITREHQGLWSVEAEEYLLEQASRI